jgi:hypothetical protein
VPRLQQPGDCPATRPDPVNRPPHPQPRLPAPRRARSGPGNRLVLCPRRDPRRGAAAAVQTDGAGQAHHTSPGPVAACSFRACRKAALRSTSGHWAAAVAERSRSRSRTQRRAPPPPGNGDTPWDRLSVPELRALLREYPIDRTSLPAPIESCAAPSWWSGLPMEPQRRGPAVGRGIRLRERFSRPAGCDDAGDDSCRRRRQHQRAAGGRGRQGTEAEPLRRCNSQKNRSR